MQKKENSNTSCIMCEGKDVCSCDKFEKYIMDIKQEVEFLLTQIMYLTNSNLTVRKSVDHLFKKYPDIHHNILNPDNRVVETSY